MTGGCPAVLELLDGFKSLSWPCLPRQRPQAQHAQNEQENSVLWGCCIRCLYVYCGETLAGVSQVANNDIYMSAGHSPMAEVQ